MTLRADLLKAARTAAEVLDANGARLRVKEGHTRIDPFAIAATEGVPVILRPLDRLLGAFLRQDRPGIIVNGARPAGLVHMTCAHELGHYFLGHQSTADETIDYDSAAASQELQADRFGYMLLMPRWLLAHVLQLKGWTSSSLLEPGVVYQLSLRLGVSYTGTVWSLHRHRLLRLEQAQRLVRTAPIDIKRSLTAEPLEDPSSQDVWLLDIRDRDLVLEPRKNDKFLVDLPSRASAGFMWSLDDAASAGFELTPVLVDGLAEPRVPNYPMVGGTRALRFRLERSEELGVQESMASLRLRELQPWRGAAASNPTFRLSTQIEDVSSGLTRDTRKQLLEAVAAE